MVRAERVVSKAVYSVGGFLGAAIGGVFAYASLTPTITFVAVAALVVALAVWSAPAPRRCRPFMIRASSGK